MSRRLLAIAAALLLVLAIAVARGHITFDWGNLHVQLRAVRWTLVLAAAALICVSVALRALRWKWLLGRATDAPATALLPAQFIGFTAVAFFGRVADLARPYLIARRTATTVPAQLAVYGIERAFDLGAAAVLFSTTLALTPATMPHHEAFRRAGILALAGTLLLATFAISVRFAGVRIAAAVSQLVRRVSPALADSLSEKILDFRAGLAAVNGIAPLAASATVSLVIWVSIAASYLCCAHAFRDTPELAHFGIASTMLLMATSMGGSLLQLPIVGWFTQIGVLAVAFHGFFGVPLEVASAAGAVTMAVGTLSVVPFGLAFARHERIGFRSLAQRSEPTVLDKMRAE